MLQVFFLLFLWLICLIVVVFMLCGFFLLHPQHTAYVLQFLVFSLFLFKEVLFTYEKKVLFIGGFGPPLLKKKKTSSFDFILLSKFCSLIDYIFLFYIYNCQFLNLHRCLKILIIYLKLLFQKFFLLLVYWEDVNLIPSDVLRCQMESSLWAWHECVLVTCHQYYTLQFP